MKDKVLDIHTKLENLISKRNKLVEERNVLLNKQFTNEKIFNMNKSEILLTTNFKERFKKDNDDIRNSFIRKECKNEIENLETTENTLIQNKNKITQIDIEISIYKKLLDASLELLKIENTDIETIEKQ